VHHSIAVAARVEAVHEATGPAADVALGCVTERAMFEGSHASTVTNRSLCIHRAAVAHTTSWGERQ